MDEINTSRIKTSQLRALVAVAECENFSEAALKLEITQSAVSHAIATLEEELGVPLFSRGRHGAFLTPAGERIVTHARAVLGLLKQMIREANVERGLQGGRVRVASFRSVATHVLPGIIARFRDRYPDISITITEHIDYLDVEQAVREGRADIGFTYLPTSEGLDSWEILRDDYVALLPPSARLAGDQISWSQLAAYPLIASGSGNACDRAIRNYLMTSEVPLNIAYEVREDSTIVSMVSQGLGAAVLPRLAAEPLPPGVRVYHLPAPFIRIIGVVVSQTALLTPAAYAFLDAVKAAPPTPLSTVQMGLSN
ncbi:MAG: LysR family transcriptional regulator [Desertifilum sp.]|nr:LysR family transcriptional regulator [Desertifilum sp.]